MKKVNYLLVSLLILFFSSTVAFANGKQENTKVQPKSVSITFATGDTTTKETIHEMVTAFNASQDKYKLQENLSISTGAYLDSLKTLNASGQMPDIFECRDVPVFVRAGMLAPLDSELKPLFDSLIPVYGTVYTAPIVAQYPYGIIYNKALFQKNGINEEPKTYADFLAICDQVKKLGIAPMAAGVADIWHIGFLFNHYLIDYVTHDNPNWVSDLYQGKTKFSSPEMEKAMTYLGNLFLDGNVEGGFMSTKESQIVSLLVTEKAAMVYTGTWTIAQIQEADPSFEIGFFPIPNDEGNIYLHGGATSQGWALNTTAAADPDKAECFKEFVKFFFSSKEYAQFLQKTNSFPTTKEVMKYETSDLMKSILDMSNKYPKRLSWNIGVGDNELPPSFRNWTYKKVQEMIMGKITVKQLLSDMDTQWATDTRDFNPTKLVNQSL
ncbi:extracellular solute-binding protein [uncultured Sphaerochaeta sp.]|uniref:ABC transporter substrate-binding protein n=1 Tax=uncultured Sphaerochaeta sp. TaxID=886478 RepID=UPI002A0A83E7|nr:extracellular solute-binding protein [uncultured Sphaerochaeta sp.]